MTGVQTCALPILRDLDQRLRLLAQQGPGASPTPVYEDLAARIDVETNGSAVGRAWLSLPLDRKSPRYGDLSNGVQGAMKEALHAALFASPDDYTRLVPARIHVFLAYCAMVPTADRRLDWYWDWPTTDARRAVLASPRTVVRMRGLLEQAREALVDDPDRARHFRPADAARILAGVDAGDPFLNSLLAAEREIVKDALAA